MYFFQKVVTFSLLFRWFIILAFVMYILFFVVLLHMLVDKCKKYWSNEISDPEVVENQEAEEQSFFNFYTVLNYIIAVLFLLFFKFSLQYDLLSPRISLLLKDSINIFSCMITMPNFYIKNPLLRHYVWKKILRISTVQPENNQIELQPI